MNRLDTTANGGFPVLLDDHRFYDEAVREAFKGAMASFGVDLYANSFIISGCVISGGPSYTCAAGWICLKGEILRVESHSVPTPAVGQIRYWSVVETNDPAGAKNFQNNVTVDTYKLRRGVIVSGVAPVDYLLTDLTVPGTPRLTDKMFGNLDALRKFARIEQEAWRMVGAALQPPFLSSWANSSASGYDCQFMKDEFNVVHIRGAVKSGTFGPSNAIFTLPVGYRPSDTIWRTVPCGSLSTTDINFVLLQIFSNGNVYAVQLVLASPAISDPVVQFDEVTFTAD